MALLADSALGGGRLSGTGSPIRQYTSSLGLADGQQDPSAGERRSPSHHSPGGARRRVSRRARIEPALCRTEDPSDNVGFDLDQMKAVVGIL